MLSFDSLALLGVGYMGGSLALAARKAGLCREVVGYDVSAEAAQVAHERGIVDKIAATPEEAVRGARLVVMAAPVRSLGALARRIAPSVPEAALVLDIGSVKAPVVRAIEATTLAGRYVGCHPLAGTEASGAAAAKDILFAGKACFLCPGPAALPETVREAQRFWEALGVSAIRLDPETHDAFMAAASHLPHVAAFTLAASLEASCALVAAHTPPSCPPTSLRDTTRVAGSNPVVWRDIFLENRRHLLPLVQRLEERLAELRRALETEDAPELERLLALGSLCRRRLIPGGSGAQS
jgi:prephenate dehydrogenase